MRQYIYNLATDKYKGLIASIIKIILFVLSLIYGLIIRILIFLNSKRGFKLEAKVISVGNITLGGTGKTSLVEYVCRILKEDGRKPAVLTRGYKTDSGCIADEPSMLQNNLKNVPVIVDADRIKGGRIAINDFGADTLVLDDGFQQWKIKKDLEIVAIDAVNPFGNGHMIPRGILREPLSSLKRADVFILTKTNLKPNAQELRSILSKISPSAEIFESTHRPMGFYNIGNPDKLLDPYILKGKNVALFSGIGDPGSFENTIEDLGINIGLSLRFSDHYNYTQKDLDCLIRQSKDKNTDIIITTEKDAARLISSGLAVLSSQLLVLRIAIEIKDEQRFHNRLLKLYSF